MKPSELLKQIGWCQMMLAKDKNGDSVEPDDPTAVSFCLVGAIHKCIAPHERFQAVKDIYYKIRYNLTCWNDMPGRTKEEVIQLLESVGL